MTKEQAEEYAKEMSFRDAVENAMAGRSVPYRRATKIKLVELLKIVEGLEDDGK